VRYLLRYDASGSARGNGYIGYIAWVNLGLIGEGGWQDGLYVGLYYVVVVIVSVEVL